MTTGFQAVDGDEQIEKDIAETLDYSIDWANRLLSFSGAIASSVWEVPSALTIETPAPTFIGVVTTIFLSGGSATVGTKHRVKNTITTTGGSPRTMSESFNVKMIKR